MAKIANEANNNTITTKARYWVGVGYPENMRTDWKDVIGEVLQLPYAYCVHDKDSDAAGDDRKDHVHIMIAFGNTTTYKSALAIMQSLSADGKKAFPTVQKVNNVRYMYNYLIHDTDDCRKKQKHQYNPSERITGNNFDIGSYEQLGVDQKKAMRIELSKLICEKQFINYVDFYAYAIANLDPEYEEVLMNYSGHFERLTRGNYLKWKFARDHGCDMTTGEVIEPSSDGSSPSGL